MLANARQPVPSWIGSGALAFSSPPRSLGAKEEPARATCPTAHTCSSPLLLHTSLPSLGYSPTRRWREISTIVSAVSAGGAVRRKVGLSCLRGGSGADGDAPQSIPTATNRRLDPEADDCDRHGAGGGRVFGGVALVTERSTATGGSKGRVSYSVLADGTLQVGRAQHQRKDSRSQTSPPPPHVSATPPPLGGSADGLSTNANTDANVATGPRKVLQELRRRTLGWKAGIGKVAKGVAGEARTAAEGARGCAVRAGVTVRGGLMNTFLPAGYPRSVRPEYVRYRCWDIVQDLSSHLRGVLATQAVLEGMGVGRTGSTPLAATLQWMARDGASMVGGLLFTSAASANFGVNIKTWRLFADASNDVGLALEMLAPLPAFRPGGRFLQLICVASVFKAACGVAGGATGAAITEHWAVDNNIADVGAKNGAQHTVASLLGLGLSVWFARAVSQSDTGSASGSRVWGWYLALTLVHLLANYAAMRTLALRSLNPARASLLVTEYLGQPSVGSRGGGNSSEGRERDENDGDEGSEEGARTQQEEGVAHSCSVGAEEGGGGGGGGEETKAPEVDWMGRRTDQGFPETAEASVLSPFAAARREKILLLPGWVRALKPWGDFLQINVGVPVRALVREADDLLWLTSLYHDEKAMVGVQVSYKPLGARMETKVNLALREDATAKDRLQAMFQANVIHRLLVRDPDSIPQGGDGVDRTLFLRKVTEEALRLTRKEFPAFRQALLREGWDLSRVTLGGGPWVGRWGSLAKED